MRNALPLAVLTAFLLIVGSCLPVLADENFGIGAKVDVKVDRAQSSTTSSAPTETGVNPIYIVVGLAFISIIAFLLAKHRGKKTAVKPAAARG